MDVNAIEVRQSVSETAFDCQTEAGFPKKASRSCSVKTAKSDARFIFTLTVVLGVFAFRNGG